MCCPDSYTGAGPLSGAQALWAGLDRIQSNGSNRKQPIELSLRQICWQILLYEPWYMGLHLEQMKAIVIKCQLKKELPMSWLQICIPKCCLSASLLITLKEPDYSIPKHSLHPLHVLVEHLLIVLWQVLKNKLYTVDLRTTGAWIVQVHLCAIFFF